MVRNHRKYLCCMSRYIKALPMVPLNPKTTKDLQRPAWWTGSLVFWFASNLYPAGRTVVEIWCQKIIQQTPLTLWQNTSLTVGGRKICGRSFLCNMCKLANVSSCSTEHKPSRCTSVETWHRFTLRSKPGGGA